MNTVSYQSVLELGRVFVGIVRALAAVRNRSPRRQSDEEKVEQKHDGKPCLSCVSLASLIYLLALDTTISHGATSAAYQKNECTKQFLCLRLAHLPTTVLHMPFTQNRLTTTALTSNESRSGLLSSSGIIVVR